jgi:hypothetical protein
MIRKAWAATASLALILMMAAGCQSSAGSTISASAAGETTIYGQVTAIDGSSITLALATMSQNAPSGEMPSGEMPSGEMPSGDMPAMPSDGSIPSEGAQPSGSQDTDAVSSATQNTEGEQPSGEAPSMPSGGQGGQRGGVELTGEEQTITISDNTAITIQSRDGSTEGTLSDIEAGDILSVTMSGNSVTAITIMQMGGGMAGGQPGGGMGGPDNSGAAPSGMASPETSSEV